MSMGLLSIWDSRVEFLAPAFDLPHLCGVFGVIQWMSHLSFFQIRKFLEEKNKVNVPRRNIMVLEVTKGFVLNKTSGTYWSGSYSTGSSKDK